MAQPLTSANSRPRRAATWGLAVATPLVLVLHVLALAWLSLLMQPPSLLKEVTKPFYTRTIAPEAVVPAAPAAASAQPAQPTRPTARIASSKAVQQPTAKPVSKAKTPARKKAPQQSASTPTPEVSQELPQEAAEDSPPDTLQDEKFAQAPTTDASASNTAAEPGPQKASPLPDASESEAPPAETPAYAAPANAASGTSPASVPAGNASDAPPAFLASWPSDTRLRYRLGGNYRGELHGDAEVLWQREGTHYQAVIQLDVGILMSSRFTSQGDITEGGLRPKVYEEQIRKKRRGVRLGDDVRLNNGERVPRPDDVQDAASQFVELGHRFATGQAQLQPGGQINFWLARPGGADEWTYDMVGEETIHLPRLGPVRAVHLKPRPLAKPRGPITAEIWFAPSLQYLPVRILITSGPDTFVDLMVETIEQK